MQKKYFYLFLLIGSVIGGIFYNLRLFDLTSMMIIIGFTDYYEKITNKKIKNFWKISLIVNVILYTILYYQFYTKQC